MLLLGNVTAFVAVESRQTPIEELPISIPGGIELAQLATTSESVKVALRH